MPRGGGTKSNEITKTFLIDAYNHTGYVQVLEENDGTIVSWGDDCLWQSPPPEGNDFVAIAAGSLHSVAMRRDGSVICWGYNERSQAAAPLTKIVEWYKYDAFGQTTIYGPDNILRTYSAVGNRYMFTGREYDWETGNYYYRARYYSPKLGRFLQTDPIGYEGGLNLYTYCRNNPVFWLDPFGLKCYNLQETQRIIKRMRSPFYNPILHAFPEAWGGYATGDNPTSATDQYTIPKKNGKGSDIIESDEFGNYLAGYGGTWNYGLAGYLAMRKAGSYYQGINEHMPWYRAIYQGRDDENSIKYINRGATDAVKHYLTPSGYFERMWKKGLL